VVVNEWQVGLVVGQLVGTVGVLMWFLRSLDKKFQSLDRKLQQDVKEVSRDVDNLQKQHYALREEIAKEYLRKDEWLAFHNKLEAKIEKLFMEFKQELKEWRDK